MGKLEGRYAIVTGAGKGIGKEIVRRFLQDGAAGVAIFEYDEGLLNKTVQELDAAGTRLLGIPCDVSSREQVALAVVQAKERFGRIDILVNNAGITRDAMFHKMTDDQWDAVLRVNLDSMYSTCKNVVPIMRAQGYGRIVNIASTSAFGNVGQANYAASKAAAIGLTATLAMENGRKNITANCIAPGYINTDMLSTIPKDVLDGYLQNIPLNRLGDPRELADVAAFLASDESSFVTGQCLTVNGGAKT